MDRERREEKEEETTEVMRRKDTVQKSRYKPTNKERRETANR